MNIEDKKQFLKAWAESLGCVFVTEGSVGFGRDCVGIIEPNIEHYVDINPMDYSADDCMDWFYVFEEDNSLYPDTDRIPDAYHKHSCLSVLVYDNDYDRAIEQLYTWIQDIVSKGDVEVVKFNEVDVSSPSDDERLFTPVYNVALTYKKASS